MTGNIWKRHHQLEKECPSVNLSSNMANCLAVENVENCAFFKEDEIMIIEKNTSNRTSLKCPSSSEKTKSEKKSESNKIQILSANFSSNSNFVVVCDNNYRVILWRKDGDVWNILSTRHCTRKCQKVIFSNLHSDIILADRGGDVYKYSSTEVNKEGIFILGHICFITDMCITSDDKYLATCDRDGKIRISNYPNCYNIHSYCLGHTMFIASASFLDCATYTLVSASGDGTLRLWDINGVEKIGINVSKDVACDSNKCDNLPIVDNSICAGLTAEDIVYSVQCFKVLTKLNIVALVFHFLKGIAVYEISNSNFQFKQFINLTFSVKDIIFLENCNLLIVSKTAPMIFQEFAMDADSCYKLCTEFSEFVKEVQKFYDGFENVFNSLSYDSMLFKKSYDDESEEPKSKKN